MTSISSVGSAWSSASLQRSAGQRTPEKLLSKLDTDQSGGVDGTELQSLIDDVAQKTGLGLDTSAKDMLAQYDADGDGSLNGEELGSAMKNLLPPPPTTVEFAQSRGMAGDDLFGKVDSDGDGSVSQDELQGLLEKMSGGTASKTGTRSDELFAQLEKQQQEREQRRIPEQYSTDGNHDHQQQITKGRQALHRSFPPDFPSAGRPVPPSTEPVRLTK